MENSTLIATVTPEGFADVLSARIQDIVRAEIAATATRRTTRYLSRFEAADLLKISLPTLAEYTRTGLIQGSRIGTRVLYSEDAIAAAVKEIPSMKFQRR